MYLPCVGERALLYASRSPSTICNKTQFRGLCLAWSFVPNSRSGLFWSYLQQNINSIQLQKNRDFWNLKADFEDYFNLLKHLLLKTAEDGRIKFWRNIYMNCQKVENLDNSVSETCPKQEYTHKVECLIFISFCSK